MRTDIYLKDNNGRNCLHIAALYGHLSLCKILKNKHTFDVHMADKNGWTVIHYSAIYGSYDLLIYFHDMGADIYVKDNDHRNCLHIAALCGHLKLCKILKDEHKFDLHMADKDGWKALHYSAKSGSYDLLKYFSDMGSDIYLKDNNGSNCLHIAAQYGHLNLCKILQDKHNFNLHMTDKDGWTAIHYSARYGSYDLFTYFADMGADIYLEDNKGSNCLHIAAQYGHLNLCKILKGKHNFDVHMANKDGWTALHYSAGYGSSDLFTYFADMVDDIYLETKNYSNCLHIAAVCGHLNLCKILKNKYKFDVHMADIMGWTALHCSAFCGSYDLFTYFTDTGAGLYRKNNVGSNCLHFAAWNGHLNLCKILIVKYKFDVHMADENGWTALHYSARYGSYDLFTYFADMGADIYLKDNDGSNCLHIAALYGHFNLCKILKDKHNFDVHMANKDGRTALHCSAVYGSYDLFTYFVSMKADIYRKSHDGWNCLHFAARHGHLNLCKILIDIHKFDVHMTTNDGWTVLHCSAKSGSFELFSYFVDKKVEIYCKTKNMENILHLSSQDGHFDICEFILNKFMEDYKLNNSKKQYALNGKSYRSQIFYKYDTIFLHAMDNNGNTYLHLAAERNHANVCELLLRYDTEIITLLDKQENTARELAEIYGHDDALKALKAEYERIGMFFYSFYTY